MSKPETTLALPQLQDAYRACFALEHGDVPGRLAAQDYLDNSTAIYHDAVIGIGFLPKIYDMLTLRHLDSLATTTYGILEKVTQRFLAEPAYRELFGFSPLLERLICLPTGYQTAIPIMRMDIFLDEDTLGFKFCEFNTDGTSAMNEDREGTDALCHSATFARASRELDLRPQELFEGWVDEFLTLYRSREYPANSRAVDDPLIAIVDYTASATPYEFEEFRARFERRGLRCLICDVLRLEYQDGALYGVDVDPSRFGQEGLQKIDAVYRRAVTGEILAELEAKAAAGVTERAGVADESGPAEHAVGAAALVRAVEERSACMIGGFLTHIAHCKQLFTVLHLPETAAFLTADENDFIRRHIPYTTRLDNQHIDLDAIKADKDRWIIKPEDGYASKGVYAGIDHDQDAWEDLIDTCSAQRYVVQSYCRQYATPNTRLVPRGEDGKRRFQTADEWKLASSPGDAERLEPWNILTGLYLYNGRFSGVYVRAGQKGIIVGFAGGITVPSFLTNYDPTAPLALRTRQPGLSFA